MSWRALLKADPVPWLLERRDPRCVPRPSVRSLTSVRLFPNFAKRSNAR